MTRPIYFISAVAALALSGLAFLGGDTIWVGLVLVLVLPLFLLGMRFLWTAAAGAIVVLATAAFGFLLDLSPAWLLPAACLALLAWDLAAFAARLRLAAPEDDLSALEQVHFTRLGMVGLAVVALTILALVVKLEFSFEWTAVLVLLGAGALGRLIYRLLRGG